MGIRATDYISAAAGHRRRLASAALLVLACGLVAVTALGGSRGLPVTGFQVATSDPPAVIDRDAQALATVAIDGVALSADGSTVAPAGPAVLTALERARADHLPTELVLSNWDARAQDFAATAARGC